MVGNHLEVVSGKALNRPTAGPEAPYCQMRGNEGEPAVLLNPLRPAHGLCRPRYRRLRRQRSGERSRGHAPRPCRGPPVRAAQDPSARFLSYLPRGSPEPACLLHSAPTAGDYPRLRWSRPTAGSESPHCQLLAHSGEPAVLPNPLRRRTAYVGRAKDGCADRRSGDRLPRETPGPAETLRSLTPPLRSLGPAAYTTASTCRLRALTNQRGPYPTTQGAGPIPPLGREPTLRVRQARLCRLPRSRADEWGLPVPHPEALQPLRPRQAHSTQTFPSAGLLARLRAEDQRGPNPIELMASPQPNAALAWHGTASYRSRAGGLPRPPTLR